MRKNVSDSIDYVKKINKFVYEYIPESLLLEIFILPSFLAIYPIANSLDLSEKIKIGAQNCCWEDEGAFTGEVSPRDLKEIGCTYVEIGHPERRNIFKEDDYMINKKIKICVRNNLLPILFIGENEKSDIKKRKLSLKNLLLKDLTGIESDSLDKIIIAYEPVWAIGAKEAAPVEYIFDSLAMLREIFKSEWGNGISRNQFIFYGGSVTAENAMQILTIENNDGISSGRGALDPEKFIEILKIAMEFKKNQN